MLKKHFLWARKIFFREKKFCGRKNFFSGNVDKKIFPGKNIFSREKFFLVKKIFQHLNIVYTKLDNKKGKNLYEFWGDRLSSTISKELEDHKDKTIINCASNEYFKSINNSSLNANVLTPEFKEIKNDKIRMISFFAKKARGMMARFIIENRIDSTDQILEFDLAGYKYDPSLSEDVKPVFTRAQP